MEDEPQNDSSSELESKTQATNSETHQYEIPSAAPPLWTDKGTITWEEVKNRDFIFGTIGSKKPAGGYYYVLRCESAPGKNTHHFLKNPWASSGHVARHLEEPSERVPKCHDDRLGRELAEAMQKEIQKALGYEGMSHSSSHLMLIVDTS
jgi:hypothetical protein